jgi:hypothetical protein
VLLKIEVSSITKLAKYKLNNLNGDEDRKKAIGKRQKAIGKRQEVKIEEVKRSLLEIAN